jgi:hypothetical protein
MYFTKVSSQKLPYLHGDDLVARVSSENLPQVVAVWLPT